jgi:hypothetical protein
MAYPQHVSQEAAIFYLVVGVGLRHLYVATKHWGLLPERLMAAIVLCVASGAFLNLFMDSLDIRPGSFWEWPHWQFYEARASVAAKLAQMPGKHLMIVKYSDTHSPHEEWVYNAADIDESKVVWANAMGRTADHDLCAYFHDRHVWIIEPDKDQYGFFPLNAGTYPDWSIWQSTKSQSLQPRSSIPR